MKILPINNGYFNYKSINNQMFKSRVQKCLCEGMGSTYDLLTLNDITYEIGQGNFYIGRDKTEVDINKLLLINMCCRFTDKEDDFYVILSAPPNYYHQQEELLPEYLKGNYNVKHNGMPKKIGIVKVKVYPETFIIRLNYQEKYRGKQLIIIDIGGYTTNIVRFNPDGGFSKNDYITLDCGMYHIDTKIRDYLSSQYLNENFNFDDIQYMREIKYKVLLEQAPTIDKFYNEHVENIINKINMKNWSIELSSVLLTGGGSIILQDNIKQYIEYAEISKNPIFDNLNALMLLAQMEVKK